MADTVYHKNYKHDEYKQLVNVRVDRWTKRRDLASEERKPPVRPSQEPEKNGLNGQKRGRGCTEQAKKRAGSLEAEK